ncbi:MAG: ROK family transcriptional regulator, partial [Gaiellaceae bacterium]
MLEAIRAGAPISRAEISRRAGISKPTVSLALHALVEAGLVREAATGPGGPSYGAVFFEPAPEAAYVLGLDLGARFLRGAVCDLSGEVRARQDVELRGADADGALRAITTLRESLIATARLPVERIDGVVLGVPGVIDTATSTLHLTTPNIPGLEGRALGLELHDRLGSEVTLENDINLAAVGEHWAGVARGVED